MAATFLEYDYNGYPVFEMTCKVCGHKKKERFSYHWDRGAWTCYRRCKAPKPNKKGGDQ